MAVLKCKMCGGPLDIATGATVIECDYCGIQQTLPKLDDEKRAKLHDRANHFRRNNEYDKAMDIYEKILNEDKTDAEAYCSRVSVINMIKMSGFQKAYDQTSQNLSRREKELRNAQMAFEYQKSELERLQKQLIQE